ncbi:MAG: T9SS type A sorting domain-containing protein [Saprospiraceae bacterium]
MKHLVLVFFLGLFSISATAQQKGGFDDIIAVVADIQIYPNPAVDYIQVTDNSEVRKVVLYNLAGRSVKNFTYQAGERYFIGDLPKGMYLVQLLGAQDKRVATRRVSIR